MFKNCLVYLDYNLILYLCLIVCVSFVFYHVVYFAAVLWTYKLKPVSESKFDKIKSYGNWVVVTGTTDGIGKCFCEKLAKRKFNLILISRNEEKLLIQSQELMEKFRISVKYITADFRKTKIYDHIAESVEGLPVGLLINNVGAAYPSPDFYTADHLSDRDFIDMLHCNCLSTVLMTRILLKSCMLKQGGVIINMSSASSFLEIPVLTMYASCKSLLNCFTNCLQAEIDAQGAGDRIFVQNFTPFWVISKLSGIKTRKFLVPTAEEFTDSCLRQLCENHQSFGYITHSYENWFLNKLIPKFLNKVLVRRSMMKLRDQASRKRDKIKNL